MAFYSPCLSVVLFGGRKVLSPLGATPPSRVTLKPNIKMIWARDASASQINCISYSLSIDIAQILLSTVLFIFLIQVIGLSWGITTTSLLKLRGKVDFIIGRNLLCSDLYTNKQTNKYSQGQTFSSTLPCLSLSLWLWSGCLTIIRFFSLSY